MVEQNISQKFRLNDIEETRNYCVTEIYQNELMRKKHKTICMVLKYIEHILILSSAVTDCISISTLSSLLDILIGTTSSAI